MVNAEPVKRRHYTIRDEDIGPYFEFNWAGIFGERPKRTMVATFVEERDDTWHSFEREKSKMKSENAALNEALSGVYKRWRSSK